MDLLPKKMIGIDFHDHSAELVELKRVGKDVYLEVYNRVNIPPNLIRDGEIKNEAEVKTILLNLFASSNPKPVEGKTVAVVLPSSKTFTHLFHFPASLTEAEIAKAITYEAETIIPFAMQDVYWDFAVLSKEDLKEKHASQTVLFVAIIKKMVDQYTQMLQSMDLHPYLFSTSLESLKFALESQVQKEESTLIIDFGTLSTHYIFMKNGAVRYFFSSNSGGVSLMRRLAKEFQIPEAMLMEKQDRNRLDPAYGPVVQEFIEEVYRQAGILMSENETNPQIGAVKTVILTGEFLNLPHFYKLAENHFKNQELLIGDPKTGLHIDVQKLLPLHQKRGGPVPYSTYFTNAIGIALRALKLKPATGINILPDELKESVSHRKETLWIGIGSIVLSVLMLCIATFLFFKHQELTYQRLELQIKKSAVEKTIYGTRYQDIREEISNFNAEVAELRQIDSNLFSMPTLLDALFALWPEGVTLSELHFEDEELSVEISGIAESRETLLTLEQNLKEASFIEEVIAPISNYDEKSQISFVIKLKLNFVELPPYDTAPSA